MKLSVSQKETSLGLRIYLYIIGLVCLSANLWFAYELDEQQQAKQLIRPSHIQQESSRLVRTENSAPQVAVISAGTAINH